VAAKREKLTEGMERWARYLEARASVADRREALANEREKLADEREELADEREQIADEREQAADQRELEENNVLGRPARHNAQRAQRAEQRVQRQHEGTLREQANIDRELAVSEREHAREQAQGDPPDPATNEGDPPDPPTNETVVGAEQGADEPGELERQAAELDRRAAELDQREQALRDVRPSSQDASGSQTSGIGSRTGAKQSQTTASRWQTNASQPRINARARLPSVNVNDCSAPKTGLSATEPMFTANRRTSTVRWPKANVVASRTNPPSDPTPRLSPPKGCGLSQDQTAMPTIGLRERDGVALVYERGAGPSLTPPTLRSPHSQRISVRSTRIRKTALPQAGS
jgi:hypothetical protein